MTPNILVIDIESLPNEGYFWDLFPDNGIPLQFVQKPKSILTIAYKWVGKKETHVLKAERPYDDKRLLQKFLPIWEDADYVVAHYGDGFDIPYIAGRLLANGLPPLPPVPSIDTYKLAKKHFGKTLNSNRLDNLGTILGVGNKNKTDIHLWIRCAKGDKKALNEMAAYNKQDVVLLEKVMLKMLPYTNSKLNMNLFSEQAELICSNCGGHDLQKRGTIVTKSVKRQRMHCQTCGSWSSAKYEKEETTKATKAGKRKQSSAAIK